MACLKARKMDDNERAAKRIAKRQLRYQQLPREGSATSPNGGSGLAELASDQVALGGFPPRALTDPYVLALEHTVPQSWVCCMSVNRMDGSYTRQRVSLERALKAEPVERAITVAAIQPLPPPTLNLAQEPG